MLYETGTFGRNNFALIRLVLAAAVLYRHSFDLVATTHGDITLDLIPPQTHIGRIALCFFMAVSGYLVTHSWQQSANWRDFLWRRVLRIYPGFIVACLFAAFVAAPLGSPDPGAYIESIDVVAFAWGVLQLGKLHLPPTFLANPYPLDVNGSLWSIKIEFECYVALIALGLAGLLRRRAVILGLFAVMMVLNAAQPYAPSSLDRFNAHLQLSTFFLAGACAYLYRDVIPRSYGWLEVAGLVLIATAILEIGFVEVLPLAGTYVLLYLAYEPRLRVWPVGSRTDLSYGLYLFAWPIQQLVVQASGGQISPWMLTGLSLALAAGLAYLSWHLVERPALRLKRRSPTLTPTLSQRESEPEVTPSPAPGS
jgi:peptidoglycan/LPS O-acetylase OafA/YrhL